MAKATLEALPAELRIQILLNISDPKSLLSLILSSRPYYESSKKIQMELAISLLKKEYQGLVDLREPIAAVRSRGLQACMPSNKEKIIALLDSWRRSDEIRELGLTAGPLPNEPASFEEAVELFMLHKKAKFFLRDFSMNAPCPKWIDATVWSKEILPIRLTETEEIRIFRAFYRLQTFTNIFGLEEYYVTDYRGERSFNDMINDFLNNGTFSKPEVWFLYILTVPPWEIEEMNCLWQYFWQRVEPLYDEVSALLTRLHKENLELRERQGLGFSPCDQSVLPKEYHTPKSSRMCFCDTGLVEPGNYDYLGGLVGTGPEFLYRFISAKTVLDRRNIFLSNYRVSYDLWPDMLRYSMEIPPSPWKDEDTPMPFIYPADKYVHGDRIKLFAPLGPSEQPNIWWKDENAEPVGEHLEVFKYIEESLTNYCSDIDWCYAFWDDKRRNEWPEAPPKQIPYWRVSPMRVNAW